MPKTAKAKKKVSKSKTKVASKTKITAAKVLSKGPVKISKTYVPKILRNICAKNTKCISE